MKSGILNGVPHHFDSQADKQSLYFFFLLSILCLLNINLTWGQVFCGSRLWNSFHRVARKSGDGWRLTWISKVELFQSKTYVCLSCSESDCACEQYSCWIYRTESIVNVFYFMSWYHNTVASQPFLPSYTADIKLHWPNFSIVIFLTFINTCFCIWMTH